MKLLVFAHVPPPYHGQSAAVKLMLQEFGGDRRKWKFRREPLNRYGIECYHVDARFSKSMEDVGELQFRKMIHILFYCLQAIWCRFRYGVKIFYYVPAPGKAVALYRDWLIMLLCRPFFDKVIFHWHGGGLAKWLETCAQNPTRSFTFRLMKHADLSIVLTEFGKRDAEKLMPRRMVIVPSGLPDPCPQFAETLLITRRSRVLLRHKTLSGEFQPRNESEKAVQVLYIAHCIREKGVFDTVEAIALANEKLAAQNSPLQFRLTIAGAFASSREEKELRELVRRRNLQNLVSILGFISDEKKNQELGGADIFCFPTYYSAEGQPASLIEALAFGLPIVTTHWRGIPGMFPDNYPGLVDIKSPAQIAEKLLFLCGNDFAQLSREIFLSRFSSDGHLARVSAEIRGVENS